MPLVKGFSAATFKKNVHTLAKEGRGHKQVIAIAYKVAREALKKARRRETIALREAWRRAVAAGLHGTGKKPAAQHVYRVTLRWFGNRKRKPLVKDVRGSSPIDAARYVMSTLPNRTWTRVAVDKVVRLR